MINYIVFRKTSEKIEESKGDIFGIIACEYNDGLVEIVKSVNNISDDLSWIKALVDKLNSNNVDPIHLIEIIDDELSEYSMSETKNSTR